MFSGLQAYTYTAYTESNSILSRRFAVYTYEHLPIQCAQSLTQVYLAVGGLLLLLNQQQNCVLMHKEGSL